MQENIKIFDSEKKPTGEEKNKIVKFLYNQLEQFGDPEEDILRAVDYALKERKSFGGCILVLYINNEIKAAVVINRTGMKGYIPENILVYIATHKDSRGKGLGAKMMRETINHVDGDISLHVEPENPAKYLYKKIGLTSKYLNMRYKKRD